MGELMKLLSFILFAISFSNVVFASDIPCNVIGTSKDPNIIKLLESKPGSSTPEESLLLYKDQYADAVRCKNKSDAARFKMYIEGLEAVIAKDKEKNGATTHTKADNTDTNKPSDAVSPAVVKEISIDCEDESTKPKTHFKIFGTDTNGVVVAEGYKDQLFVRVLFNNRKPDDGRSIELVINGETNRFIKNPGLGPIGINPGWAMKLLLKAIGLRTDLKITCFPLSQKDVPKSQIKAKAEIMVNDSDRALSNDSPAGIPTDSSKPASASHQ